MWHQIPQVKDSDPQTAPILDASQKPRLLTNQLYVWSSHIPSLKSMLERLTDLKEKLSMFGWFIIKDATEEDQMEEKQVSLGGAGWWVSGASMPSLGTPPAQHLLLFVTRVPGQSPESGGSNKSGLIMHPKTKRKK